METLIKLIVLALAVYGLANAITVLKAGKPIRTLFEILEGTSKRTWVKGFWTFWKTLFSCPPCLSFWIGMAASYWVLSITKGLIAEWWMVILVDGLIVSATSWLLHLLAERMGYGLDL